MIAMVPPGPVTSDPVLLDMLGEREAVSPGRLFRGRWLVLRLLDRGSQCLVHEVMDTGAVATTGPDVGRLPRSVLKALRPALADQPASLAFLDWERRVLDDLGSLPGIAPLQGVVDRAEGGPALLLARAPGYALGAWLGSREGGPGLPRPWVRPLLLSLAETVAALHARGVVHGDIKPGNVMVAPGGVATLIDFGSARLHGEPPQAFGSVEVAPLDKVAVTPTWASPRQAGGRPPEPADDVYALALLVARLIWGRHAFGGEAPGAALKAGRRALRPRGRGIGCPLSTVLEHGLNTPDGSGVSLADLTAGLREWGRP
jgi:serine/threonine protein kinase